MRSYAEQLLECSGQHESLGGGERRMVLDRRRLLQWSAGLLASTSFCTRLAAGRAEEATRASTSRASRQEAMRQLPLRSLKEPLRTRVQQIVTDPTIYRRLPIEVIACDPDLYLFLVRYPEVVVNMWQLMGVTKAVIRRSGAYAYDALDGAGTVSQVELVYGTRDQHLFLAEGYYEGPLLPRRVTGRCVLLLTSGYSQDLQERDYISNRLDVFLQLDKVGIEIVAKTLHPLMGRTVDTNFSQSARFISQVSRVAETNGPGVQRLVSQLTKVQPEVRTQFAKIASSVNQRATLDKMDLSRAGQSGETRRLTDAIETADAVGDATSRKR